MVIPLSIGISTTLNGTLGFAMLIALMFCMPADISSTLDSDTYYPFMTIYQYAVGSSTGATAMVSTPTHISIGEVTWPEGGLMSTGLHHNRDPILCHSRHRCNSLSHALGIRPRRRTPGLQVHRQGNSFCTRTRTLDPLLTHTRLTNAPTSPSTQSAQQP